MNKNSITRCIANVQNDITRLQNALYAMDSTSIQQYPDNYETLSVEAALRAEKITCELRHLIYTTTAIQKAEYLRKAGETQGIKVTILDGITKVSFPSLLPKRKYHKSAGYILDNSQ